MSKVTDDGLENELKVIESEFNRNITNMALEVIEKNGSIQKENYELVTKNVQKDIKVDVERLTQKTNELLDKNEEISDEEIAIQLLKDIASNNKSKTMRKIASKMIKEKWWIK